MRAGWAGLGWLVGLRLLGNGIFFSFFIYSEKNAFLRLFSFKNGNRKSFIHTISRSPRLVLDCSLHVATFRDLRRLFFSKKMYQGVSTVCGGMCYLTARKGLQF